MDKLKIWVDMQAPPDVQFFRPFVEELSPHKTLQVTARDYAETVSLLRNFGIEHSVIGAERSSSNIIKTIDTITRTLKLHQKIKNFDVCLTLGNLHSIYISKLRRKICINFTDNELGLKRVDKNRSIFEYGVVKSETLLADYIIVPSAFPVEALVADGMDRERIYTFDGYKEDVYIADFNPDPSILEELPFDDFIIVRPETYAIYKERISSLVPKLVDVLINLSLNVVYLPRIPQDLLLLKKERDIKGFFIPKKTLNGLDLCYYSQAVLTGSGTLAREAACMGTTAVSFFPGQRLLAVDQQLVNEGKMFHSRNVDKIVNYVVPRFSRDKKPDLEKCKKVKKVVINITKNLIETLYNRRRCF